MKLSEHLDQSDQEMIEMLEEQAELHEEDEHLEAISLAISSIKLDSSLKNYGRRETNEDLVSYSQDRYV